LRIGALATIYSVANSSMVKEKFTILSHAANSIASTQVQNRGTIVGNICNAVPSADSAPTLLCLGAKLLCLSKGGERTMGVEDFFTGPNSTSLNSDELLKEIQIANMPEASKGVYIKLSPRKRMDLAVVGVAAVVSAEKETFKQVRIGLGAVAPTPIRAKKAEERLVGRAINEEAILEAAKLASEESEPIDDHRASAEYRRTMVEVLVKRAINQALSN
jgi:carbon-monoxide dehydrogenase medium subunit